MRARDWQFPAPVWHKEGVFIPSRKQIRSQGARERREGPALDAEALERLGLHYVGRYATSRGKLIAYLKRKLTERGWVGDQAPDLAAQVERYAALGYVDDQAFAEARARSLGGRGYGQGRVRQALHAARIDEEHAASAHEIAFDGRWAAALRYAEKRRIGPWARVEPDRPARQKAIAAMIRGGHDFELARVIVSAQPGEIPEDVPK